MSIDTHTRNYYRKFSGTTTPAVPLEPKQARRLPSDTCVVPVSLFAKGETGTRLEPASPRKPKPTAMFVSTCLQSWISDQPEFFARDVQLNDTAYRRLDPEYYAWLRSKMQLAKMALAAGNLDEDQFDDMRHRFNAMHDWAGEHIGEPRLLDAIRNLDARGYAPPVAESDALSRAPETAHVTSAEALALVDAICERAVALGWTHESLYAQAGPHRAAIGVNRGLVCFLMAGDRIGEVTLQAIEIIHPLPSEARHRFYNPDVDQPWIRRARCPG